MFNTDRWQARKERITSFWIRSLLAVIFLFAFLLAGCRQAPLHKAALSTGCERVVSLSPSITEVLYALDLGPQVAGVTRYCKYPPQARKKPQVGGYIDPDAEALLRLRPDLVVLREEQTQLVHQLRGLGFPLLTVDHRNTEGILKSIDQVGHVCHREKQAQALRQTLSGDIEAVRSRIKTTRQRPSVLVVIDRDVQSEKVHWVFVAGEDGFYDWLVENAGGKNAVPSGKKGFLQISPEGILRMNPDVIIETTASVGPGASASSESDRNREIEKQWGGLSQVSAVKNHRVYHFGQDYMVIPGPRFTKVLRAFAQVIHPELDWKHEPRSASSAAH